MRWREHRGLVALAVLLLICVLGTAGVFLTRPAQVHRAHSGPSAAGTALYDDGGIRFAYPAAWFAGVWTDQNGPVALSAGPAALLTFLSDFPFEPMCRSATHADGSTTEECDPPPGRAVAIRWTSPTGFSDGAFVDREFGHARVFDGHLGWSYEGPGRHACLAGQHEVAVGVPYDAGQPDRSGVEMLACLQGPKLAQHLLEVHRMVASMRIEPAPKPGQVTAGRCWDGVHRDVIVSGETTVGWVRAQQATAFPGAAPGARAEWCWTYSNSKLGFYQLWVVSEGHRSLRLGYSTHHRVPRSPSDANRSA